MNTKKFLIALLVSVTALVLVGGVYGWYTNSFPADIKTNPYEEDVPADGKLNIKVICESALAYMSFPNAETANQFLLDCEAGLYPEVIERYKADNNLGDGAMI